MSEAQVVGAIPAGAMPVLTRLQYAVSVFAIQKMFWAPTNVIKSVKRLLFAQPHHADAIKKYPCRPGLPVTVFLPQAYEAGNAQKYPVLFTIHGGAFIIGNPHDQDHWNRMFASKYPVVVVGLNYAKAPGSPFPGPVHDIGELVQAVLADQSLPIDHSAGYTLLGWSAGGNLALAASQLDSLRAGNLRGVVCLYPVVDLSIPTEVKLGGRRYKPELGGFRARETDMLLPLAPLVDWSYRPIEVDVRDPLLSPAFAEANSLPQHIVLVGCELDMLAHEAWAMACRLAEKEAPDKVVGKQEASPAGVLVLDDERFFFERMVGEDSKRRTVRWLLIPDQIHGFDHEIDGLVRDPRLMADARAKLEQSLDTIAGWLLSGPLRQA